MATDLALKDELKQLLWELNPTQMDYLSALIYLGEPSLACEKTGIPFSVVAAWPAKDTIIRAAQLAKASRLEAVIGTLEYYAVRAVHRIWELAQSEDEQIALKANTWIVEQGIGKPKTKSENLNINASTKMYGAGFDPDAPDFWKTEKTIEGKFSEND